MSKQNQDKNMKSFIGMPMRWESKKMFKNFWNSKDDRIFLPKYFGIGWDLNLRALLKKTGLVKDSKATSKKNEL